MPRILIAFLSVAIFSCMGTARLCAEDWPTWRFDARRSNASPQQLSDQLQLAWSRELPLPMITWPDQEKLAFHRVSEPIVIDHSLIVVSSRNDDVTAFDTRSGERRWQFRADGPIRFAPAAAKGKLYVASDDGYLYCLDASTGDSIWRFRGGPSDRKLLGNNRLVSTWPARGAPVIADDTVYFAASIWPFMGIFIHALDADTGQVIWTNDGDGSMFIKQPHNTDSFAGVAPQGPLVVAGERLLIPGGRSVPACYDRRTGRFEYYELAENGKRGGGFEVVAGGELFFNGMQAFKLDDGTPVGSLRGQVAAADDGLYVYSHSKNQYEAYDWDQVRISEKTQKDRRGREYKTRKLELAPRWTLAATGGEALILAGGQIYGAGDGKLVAIAQPTDDDAVARVTWQAEIEGTPARLIAADDRLFAVTTEGTVFAYAATASDEPPRFRLRRKPLPPDRQVSAFVAKLLQQSPLTTGYAVVLGVGDGGVVRELLRQTDFHVVAVEPDQRRAASLRDAVTQSGLYGDRCSVHQGSPADFPLPPYLASMLVVAEDDVHTSVDVLARQFQVLRPYGGAAWAILDESEQNQLATWAAEQDQPGLEIDRHDQHVALVRAGAIPGSGNWTHENADASNTRVSPDAAVRAPLGLLWFGGMSNEGVLPRHGHGPQPQVIDGRLVIEGTDMIRATDIYTGRLLWQREFPDIGFFFNNLGHQPGANGSGTNFISTTDGVYVVYQGACQLLDLDTGATQREFRLPPDTSGKPASWSYINVVDDYLVAGSNPLISETDDEGKPAVGKNDNLSGSKRLFVLDRASGQVIWRADAVNYFRHNAICAGGGRLFAVDLLSDAERERLKRRGETPDTVSQLFAFDLATGQTVWTTQDAVFGTCLSYSVEHDVLVEAGRPGRDVLGDEAKGMRAFRGTDGDLLWHEDHNGPAMLHGDVIHVPHAAYYLLTGKPVLRDDPVTGEPVAWTWTRNYGCNQPIVSQNLLTFRSGAAGYYDLANDGGTGNFGGFRSGCTNNLIVAGGVLSAPDYTRTCVCSYQNQSSVALVHMPEAEMWTEFPVSGKGALQHLAWNLGAPGTRRGVDGTLWLHETDRAEVRFDGTGFYNEHSSRVNNDPRRSWIAASGCRGIGRIEVDLKGNLPIALPADFTVRLYFCEPDFDEPGQRQFDVRLQSQPVLEEFDIAAEAGGFLSNGHQTVRTRLRRGHPDRRIRRQRRDRRRSASDSFRD